MAFFTVLINGGSTKVGEVACEEGARCGLLWLKVWEGAPAWGTTHGDGPVSRAGGSSTKAGWGRDRLAEMVCEAAGRVHACIVGVGGRVLWVKVWGGLRGAVGMVMALFIFLDTRIHNSRFKSYCIFYMGTMAFFTVLINGGSTKVRDFACEEGACCCAMWLKVWEGCTCLGHYAW
jgi:hypothetical protein